MPSDRGGTKPEGGKFLAMESVNSLRISIVRELARGDKPYLRKSTDRKAQISPLN